MEHKKDTSVGYALTVTLNVLRKNFNKKIKQYDISSEQYGVLKLVFETEKLTPTQIAELLKRDKATITRIIKSLEKKELIKKENINNRSFNILLTKKGIKTLKEVEKIAINYHKKIFEEVGEKEILQMFETLKKIREIFKG